MLLLSLAAMLAPFSWGGLSRFLRSDPRRLVSFTYGYGLVLLGWRLWDQLTLPFTSHPRWQPYRRRQPQAEPTELLH